MQVREAATLFDIPDEEVEAFLDRVKQSNLDAYSVQLVASQPGELEDSLNAVVTYYGDEPGAAANRFYVRY